MRSAGPRSANKLPSPKISDLELAFVNLKLTLDRRRQDARTEERQVTMEMPGSPPGPTERAGPCEPGASL